MKAQRFVRQWLLGFMVLWLVGLFVTSSPTFATVIMLDNVDLSSGSQINDFYEDTYGVTFEGLTIWADWNYTYAPKKYPSDKIGVPRGLGYDWFRITFNNPIIAFGFVSTVHPKFESMNKLQAYNGSTLVYDQHFTSGFGEWYPTSVTFTEPVSTIKVVVKQNHSGFDNFMFTAAPSPPAPVPEPATILLFGIGLIGLMSVAARHKKRKQEVPF